MNFKFSKGQLVWFNLNEKYCHCGYVENFWKVKNESGNLENNYIINDFANISHERFESELMSMEKIDNSTLEKLSGNIPTEIMVELFSDIDKRYSLFIELKKNYVYAYYGLKDNPCVIGKNGELIDFVNKKDIPVTVNADYIHTEKNQRCEIISENLNKAIFQLYVKIISRKK